MLIDIYDFAHKVLEQNKSEITTENVYDFGAANRAGEVFPFDFYFCCEGETTATGDPKVDIIIESADDDEFTENVTEHVMFSGLTKEDISEDGGVHVQPLPYGVRRFARVKIKSDAAIACMTYSCGITPIGQMNRNRVPKADSMTHWAPTVRP